MIAALHITRMLRCTLHFFDVTDTYMLIYNYILQNGILTDDYVRKDYAVLHYGTFLMIQPRLRMEWSIVPSMRHPLEITDALTSAPSRYCVGQLSLVRV